MINTDQINDLIANGATVFDSQGEKIGSLGQIYLDDVTNQPSWLTVNTGLFGMSENFVPLDNATVNGDEIHVAYTKDQVKDAPKMDPDGHLDPAEEDRLYAHYGQSDPSAVTTDGTDRREGDVFNEDNDGKREVFGDDRDKDYVAAGGVADGTDRREGDVFNEDNDGKRELFGDDRDKGYADRDVDLDRDVDQDTMVRSEERLNVGTEQRETGRARLRKYVVTENVQQTVPVSHEEVRVERTPLDEGDTGRVGTDLGEDELTTTLHEERPVVSTETVPVEEVRLEKETVTDQETVGGEVRREEIDVEGVDGADDPDLRGDQGRDRI